MSQHEYDVNNPNRWDYQKLFKAYKELEERLAASEASESSLKDRQAGRIASLNVEAHGLRKRLEEATELVKEAGEEFERMDRGELVMCGLNRAQPYMNFVMKNIKI
mgnify:CR=1 FL=1|tara:strand:+ start:25159 stop:25476 length:318 start_codon:yes stop_codon:yes gene_type:complete